MALAGLQGARATSTAGAGVSSCQRLENVRELERLLPQVAVHCLP
jgi:hypothetical protein